MPVVDQRKIPLKEFYCSMDSIYFRLKKKWSLSDFLKSMVLNLFPPLLLSKTGAKEIFISNLHYRTKKNYWK